VKKQLFIHKLRVSQIKKFNISRRKQYNYLVGMSFSHLFNFIWSDSETLHVLKSIVEVENVQNMDYKTFFYFASINAYNVKVYVKKNKGFAVK
jgi:hypothetical protein